MVTGSRMENLAALFKTNHFTIVSGVLPELGGNDEGPNPHEILETALGACTVITVQMYANRKQWDLKSTDVTVKVDSEGEKTHITRTISFQGDLSAEQREKLLEIANKCPIHRLLLSQVEIETKGT